MFDADATNIANVEEEVEDLRFLLNPTNPTLPTHSLSFSLSLSLSLLLTTGNTSSLELALLSAKLLR